MDVHADRHETAGFRNDHGSQGDGLLVEFFTLLKTCPGRRSFSSHRWWFWAHTDFVVVLAARFADIVFLVFPVEPDDVEVLQVHCEFNGLCRQIKVPGLAILESNAD
jgi:hypothetical protein